MVEFGPTPSDEAIERQREQWVETRDTRQRIKDVIVGIHEPTPVAQIAERAECSPNAARKHLKELADLGVARTWTGQHTRYARNDEYFRWRRANELATKHTDEELLDRLQSLEAADTEFQEKYEVSTPDAVPFPEDVEHEMVHERWETVNEWASIRRDTGVYHDAIRIAQRRQHDRLSA
ncbi:winged helix-turn-helix domain-containing protein [Halocatena marina]|uniref:winged helix-turn-helix domain-containing protein n=1 Tax=Halocatena marina TaxID=2934937 RepID=UPI00200F3C7C|nr:winged helix-turn-helix domain-containing protein [Halocatena marina]